MQQIRGLFHGISEQYRSDARERRLQTFNAIMIHFAQIVWHYDAMFTNFQRGIYNVACYHAACVIEHYSNFTILFGDLRFDSRSSAYCDVLFNIINMKNDYPQNAQRIIDDSHQRVLDMCVVPPYVTVSVEITRANDENDVDCEDRIWRACGMFFCYLNLIRLNPIRAIGNLYLSRMQSASAIVAENDQLFSALNCVEHLKSGTNTIETLSAEDAGQPYFDIERGYVSRVESIL
jgi:hypothetical protein